MSLSLGEKLRTAREERGISISEVAEQTRISPLYLEAIESDNYKTLPGGIFNKGFVRSYAKYVGIDEQEALQDYSRLVAEAAPAQETELRTYRPEVLTDDRAATSIVPTVIFAAVILGLMTAGVLFLVNYIKNQRSEPPIVANTANNAAGNSTNTAIATSPENPVGGAPTMNALKVEFTAVGDAVSLTSVVDSGKGTERLIEPGTPVVFEPKESLKLKYSRSRAQFAQLKLNGKQIALPQQPLNAKAATIEVELNQSNLASVWQNASFTGGSTSEAGPPANTAPQAPATRPTPKATGTPKPAASNTNAAPPPTMTGKPPTMTGKPAATPNRPPSNNER